MVAQESVAEKRGEIQRKEARWGVKESVLVLPNGNDGETGARKRRGVSC